MIIDLLYIKEYILSDTFRENENFICMIYLL